MFPWVVPGLLLAATVVLTAWAVWQRATGAWWRFLAALVLIAVLVNPVLVDEERVTNPDVVAVVVDESPSQQIGSRSSDASRASRQLVERLEKFPNLEVREIRAGGEGARQRDGTYLFGDIQKTLANVIGKRVGGTFLVTDGQVHDAPDNADDLTVPGPVHILLTGSPDEVDRRLVIVNAPRFGLVGKDVDIELMVTDDGGAGSTAGVRVLQAGKPERLMTRAVDRKFTVKLPIEHAGPNVIQIEATPLEGEITTVNNRAALQVNGVRERLRVLLVSGEPYAGGRVWRNFLKADPSVDLVHITILRSPEKMDATPMRELSLISFPTRELFEEKIGEFDLIIFDRYRRRGILPGFYLENVVRYVEEGGALLAATGPAFATALSLYRTPLGSVLPGEPTGRIIERGLLPEVTEYGLRHPITASLPGRSGWGRWFRQVAANASGGRILMTGADRHPLLIVNRVGEGRVAQLLSDNVWLWARGFENGGPHSEALRRLSHWLMQEPELEEEALRAVADSGSLVITRRSASETFPDVTVTTPSGGSLTVALEPEGRGLARAVTPVKEMGMYRLEDGERSTVVAVGSSNPREFADMRATRERLAAARTASGGGFAWLSDGLPDLRRVRPDRALSGNRWMGVVANRDYRVAKVREIPLLPALLALLLTLGTLAWAWRQEGR